MKVIAFLADEPEKISDSRKDVIRFGKVNQIVVIIKIWGQARSICLVAGNVAPSLVLYEKLLMESVPLCKCPLICLSFI